MFLFFPFLISSTNGQTLIEFWECGTDKFIGSKALAQFLVSGCLPAVQDHANLCCKMHDYCYDHHFRTGVTQELCDIKFCNCLQDANDKAKNHACESLMNQACSAVQTFSNIFPTAIPPDHSNDYINFIDYKPLNLDMKSILDACPMNDRITVHCHNTVYRCLIGEHEMKKRSIINAVNAYQDCRSTMYDCLRAVIETSPNDHCTSTVLRERQKINMYQKISSEEDGNSINNAYPIIASRLVEKCPMIADDLHNCYKSFHFCDVNTAKVLYERLILDLKYLTDATKHPQYRVYDEVRRINITCHLGLRTCLQDLLSKNHEYIFGMDACDQAFGMALNRIREKDFYTVEGFIPHISKDLLPEIKVFNM